jgi:predicted DNA-binding transcriptional regulator
MKSIIYLFIYMLENETGIGILFTLWRLALAFFYFYHVHCYQLLYIKNRENYSQGGYIGYKSTLTVPIPILKEVHQTISFIQCYKFFLNCELLCYRY